MKGNVNFIHRTAIVEPSAKIGNMTHIWHFCHIDSNAEIGKNCSLGQNVYVGKGVKIGNGCKIQNNVFIPTGVVIGDSVFLGPNATFTNISSIPRAFINKKNMFETTMVHKGVSIGANATVLCGISIGEYAMIGAGTVLTKSVYDFGLVVGNPGKMVGRVSKSGDKIDYY